MLDFLYCVGIGFGILAFFTAGDTVQGEVAETAIKFCQSRGGLKSIETYHHHVIDFWEDEDKMRVTCLDESSIQYEILKKKLK